MSCGQNQETCSSAADATVEAAKLVGWKADVVDFAGDPSKAQNQIRQAVAAKYDAIITYALDCPLAEQALREAHAAGVKLVAAESQECTTPVYDHVVSYTQGDFPTWFKAFGKLQAQVALAEVPNARVLLLHETDVPDLEYSYSGVKDAVSNCDGCKVVGQIDFTGADFGPALEQKVSQALVQYPTTNLVVSPYDAVLTASVVPALRSAGKANMFVAAAEGQSGVIDSIRSGSLKATGAGIPQGWEGYASVDSLNRLFAGTPQTSSGIGLQAYGANHNLPASGPYAPPIDYKSAYKKIWGVN